jgi:NDP-sugar pyrophosphorylase family protein
MIAPPCVVILAGGLATRLRPITETIPKALVPVAGRPFLAHQLALLERQGLTDVVLCVGYLGEQIETAFGDGAASGIRLRYSHDGPNLRGTGGAIQQALPLLGDDFLVLYGDSYLPIDFRAVAQAFRQGASPALMTVVENSGGKEPSNVWFEQGMVRVYDKKKRAPQMHHIDYGLSAYRTETFRACACADLSDMQSRLAENGQLAGYEVTVPYHEIGSLEGLRAFEEHLSLSP